MAKNYLCMYCMHTLGVVIILTGLFTFINANDDSFGAGGRCWQLPYIHRSIEPTKKLIHERKKVIRKPINLKRKILAINEEFQVSLTVHRYRIVSNWLTFIWIGAKNQWLGLKRTIEYMKQRRKFFYVNT